MKFKVCIFRGEEEELDRGEGIWVRDMGFVNFVINFWICIVKFNILFFIIIKKRR